MTTPTENYIQNPILRGAYPDPSFLRVGDDYYIANSTFEWFPGVVIHHSRDLKNWYVVGHALTRTSQLDLRGIVESGGVWAPSLSYADGKFWLIYTIVRTRVGNFKDVNCYLTTADSVEGPWTDPIYLDSIGFDPSLFHDDDGRKWLCNMEWDFRKGHNRFAGIVVQEYDPTAQTLVGPVTKILQKKELTEGPNLYKRDGWYYLMLAEGGTGWNHGISMARARKITGPYELDPQTSVLTTRDTPNWPLQKAGHGELVQTPSGDWYLAHLCGRPVGPDRRCILGRETALEPVVWSDDGWLRLAHGGVLPALSIPEPAGLAPHPWPLPPARDDFDVPMLGLDWQSLRVPADESWSSLTARPGFLRLRGRESVQSLFEQSIVTKRLTSVRSTAETCVEFAPETYMQMAGLLCWYDQRTYYYLRITRDETMGKVLGIVLSDDGVYDELEGSQVAINDWPRTYLRAVFEVTSLQFYASPDGESWQPIGPPLDATKLSDDYGAGLHFTGTFVGLCAQDLKGAGAVADFDYFELRASSFERISKHLYRSRNFGNETISLIHKELQRAIELKASASQERRGRSPASPG